MVFTNHYDVGIINSTTSLLVLGHANNESIDMKDFRNVSIRVRANATSSSGPLNNLKLYYSYNNSDFCLGETIELTELNGNPGHYQGYVRLIDVGAQYIQFYSIGISGTPTAYFIDFCRYN